MSIQFSFACKSIFGSIEIPKCKESDNLKSCCKTFHISQDIKHIQLYFFVNKKFIQFFFREYKYSQSPEK